MKRSLQSEKFLANGSIYRDEPGYSHFKLVFSGGPGGGEVIFTKRAMEENSARDFFSKEYGEPRFGWEIYEALEVMFVERVSKLISRILSGEFSGEKGFCYFTDFYYLRQIAIGFSSTPQTSKKQTGKTDDSKIVLSIPGGKELKKAIQSLFTEFNQERDLFLDCRRIRFFIEELGKQGHHMSHHMN